MVLDAWLPRSPLTRRDCGWFSCCVSNNP